MSFFVESIFSSALKRFFNTSNISYEEYLKSESILIRPFFLILSLFLNTANSNNRVAASDDVVSLEGAFTNYVDKKRWIGLSRLVI